MANFVTPTTMYDVTTRMYTVDVNISWSKPMSPNRVITSYEVTVAQTDNTCAIVYTNDSLTVTSVTQSVMVLPFTNYTVTVTASTSAGQGEKSTIMIESPEAREDHVHLNYKHYMYILSIEIYIP